MTPEDHVMCLMEIGTLDPPAYEDPAFARWCQETATAMEAGAVVPQFDRQVLRASDGAGRQVQTMAERRKRTQQSIAPTSSIGRGEKVAVNVYVYHQVRQRT